jgi:hypothetical protein
MPAKRRYRLSQLAGYIQINMNILKEGGLPNIQEKTI